MNHCHWKLLPPVPDEHLANTAGLSPLVSQLLYNRGLSEPAQVELFIAADSRLLGDPLLLPDMQPAVARVYRALLSAESIAVYGDFDVDGITGTAILVQGLSLLGAKATPYIPHRLTEGYGLKTAALENLRQQGISLVITVDCGITAVSEVRKAKKMGLDIIVTDHHVPTEVIPPATAVIDPRLPDSAYPFPELAGVGVAFKFLQALFQSIGKEAQLHSLIDLAALGTIADMTPLLGENRYLVKEGLKLINDSPRLGLSEMITQAGLSTGNLDAETVSWVIAPRLNAAGRLAHAMSSYQLLMTDSLAEAQGLTSWLQQKNEERQRITTQVLSRAREQILAQEISPVLIAGDEDCPVGIAGLIAGRLSDEFYRPAVFVRIGEQISSGSCRSIPEFDILQALGQCQRLLSRFGGHSQAAGLALPTRNLPRFKQCLSELAASQLGGLDLRPSLDIDAEVALPDLSEDTFSAIQQLAPFGCGNPLPIFLSRQVEIVDCRTMGSDGAHLRLKLQQGGTLWEGVGFGLGNFRDEISSPLDIVYNLEIDRWGGKEKLRLNILDFAPAGMGREYDQ